MLFPVVFYIFFEVSLWQMWGDALKDKNKIRILLAKPGLDGHDRGVKVVAQALIESGFEVIYTGLHQTIDQIVNASLQEDPQVIGLSILSGAHIPLCKQLFDLLAAKDIRDIPVVVGGVIPAEDHDELYKLGVSAIFTAGSKFGEISTKIREVVRLD